jgi:hypothetical protein
MNSSRSPGGSQTYIEKLGSVRHRFGLAIPDISSIRPSPLSPTDPCTSLTSPGGEKVLGIVNHSKSLHDEHPGWISIGV